VEDVVVKISVVGISWSGYLVDREVRATTAPLPFDTLSKIAEEG
jgi:hypothetical protein